MPLAAPKPMTQSTSRNCSRASRWVRSNRMPHTAGGSAKASAPRPRSCMPRSDTTAPPKPRRLRAVREVAWLRLGSSIDQVARATVKHAAPTSRARPVTSVARRVRNARSVSMRPS